MPKQVLQVTDFSGGLNAYKDARDIKDNEFIQNWNFMVDKAGIIRMGGQVENHINTEFHSNENFNPGFGLFQFDVDYSISNIDASFGTGLKTGTLSGVGSATATLEASYTGTLNEFADMIIFIFSGTGIGQSRKITSNTAATPTVLTVDNAWATNPTGAEYIIYRWKPDDINWAGKAGAARMDFITNGINANMLSGPSTSEDDYYIFSKSPTIADDESLNLGYVEYAPSLTLKPGVNYRLSFDCAAKDRWYQDVSDGEVTGIVDTGIITDNSSGTTVNATIASTQIDVNGALGASLVAMKALILNRNVYDEDGVFIGKCTAVTYASTSDGTVTFGNGIAVNVTNDTDLYVEGHGDKVPWVQLYSTTVAEDIGSIKTLSAVTPTSFGSYNTGAGSWEKDLEHKGVTLDGTTTTSAKGSGVAFNIKTDANGNPTFHFTGSRGIEYADTETITYTDPGSTSNTATITISAVNRVGLSLGVGGQWVSGTEQSNYLTKVNSNYIDNGDFKTAITTEWTVESALTASEETTNRYNGHDGTIKITGNNANNMFLKQTLTLDDLTWYHLNFVYDTDAALRYVIHDNTSNQQIFSDILDATRTDTIANIGQRWKFPYSANGSFNYIKFFVPKSPVGNTSSISIKFRPAVIADNTGDVYMHGVTVHKAHNDLSSMNYNDSNGASPFSTNIQGFSTYNTSFKVPSHYSEASDWVLRLHAGQYGFTASNTLSTGSDGAVAASNSHQDVFFDNIRLTAENNETVTLLTNNNNQKSKIFIHGSTSDSWIPDKLVWNDVNSKPVYDYVNGMLKISDGNFASGNLNKLMYYDTVSNKDVNNYKGWVVREQTVARPPSIIVKDTEAGDILLQHHSLIPYMNEILHQRNYRDTVPIGQGGTNWPMDVFGVGHNVIEGSSREGPDLGHVIRYWDNSNSGTNHPLHTRNSPGHTQIERKGYAGYGGALTGLEEFQIWNPNSAWFGDMFGNDAQNMPLDFTNEGDGQSLDNEYPPNNSSLNGTGWGTDGFLGGGWSTITGQSPDAYLTPIGMNSGNTPVLVEHSFDNVHEYNTMGIFYDSDDHPTEKVRNPLCIAVPPSFWDNLPSNAGDVAKVIIEFKYDMQGAGDYYYKEGIGWYIYNQIPPHFEFSAGKYNPTGGVVDSSENAMIELMVGGDKLPFIDSDAPEFIGTYKNDDPEGDEMHLDRIPDDSEYNLKWDDEGRITNVYFGVSIGYSEFGTTGASAKLKCEVGRDETVFKEILKGEVTKNDVLIINLKEKLEENLGNRIDNMFRVGFTPFATYSNYRDYFIHHGSHQDERQPFGMRWSRFIIEKLDVQFYNDEYNVSVDVSGGKESQVNFLWDFPQDITTTGWGTRIFKIASTSINAFDEESYLNEASFNIGEDGGESNLLVGQAPSITVYLGNEQLNDPYITKTKFYMKDIESDIWYLQFYIDHKTQLMHSSTSGIKATKDMHNTNVSSWTLDRKNFRDFNEVNSYESETMVSQDDAKKLSTLSCRYQTSVVANNRIYVGNILQDGVVHGDRMIKSPIGKYNLLPASNFIDVAINDGDEITALEYYKDKILQFKKKKVFVINVSGDYEFLEDTFNDVGVKAQASVVRTPHGIVWANYTGCYLYDGEKLTNLIDGKIPATAAYDSLGGNYWIPSLRATSGGIPGIGYIENRDSLIVKADVKSFQELSGFAAGQTYHFPTKSWAMLQKVFNSDGTANGVVASNFITNTNGDVMSYYKDETTKKTEIVKWTNTPLTHSAKVGFFTTKDFTFGDIAARKKIYKIYITYKTDSNSIVTIKLGTNGANAFPSGATGISASKSVFAGTSTACYHAVNGLLDTGDVWKTAELKFTTPSDYNNIYSFQISLSAAAGYASDFEVNDISIVYRVKRIK